MSIALPRKGRKSPSLALAPARLVSHIAVALCILTGASRTSCTPLLPRFNLDALPEGSSLRAMSAVDLATRSPLSEGVVRVDVFVNERFIAQERIEFRAVPAGGSRRAPPAPCLARELLVRGGVDPIKLDEASRPAAARKIAGNEHHTTEQSQTRTQTPMQSNRPQPEDACLTVNALSPDAATAFDAAELRLDISIPQVLMTRIARGSVDPAQWDEGITAAFLDYSASTLSERTSGGRSLNSTLHYSAGFNAGLWHWRYRGWLVMSGLHRLQHQPVRWSVERPVPAWHMVFGIGEMSSANPLFSSVPLYGATLHNDERMLPDSRRGYAPPIRGLATSPSRVTVSQRDSIVHETTVPAGPFVIDDLNPVVNRGDLDVEIAANTGGIQRFSIPSASTSTMVRTGDARFAFSIGCHRTQRCGDLLLDAGARYGLLDRLTVQTGFQWAPAFTSLAAGAAMNAHAGALSFDAGIGIGSPAVPVVAERTGTHDPMPVRVSASRVRIAYATALPSLLATLSTDASLRLGTGSIDLREWFASRQANERRVARARPQTGAALSEDTSIPFEIHLRGFFAQTLHRRFWWHASAALHFARPSCCGKPSAGGFDYQIGAGTLLGAATVSLNVAQAHHWRHDGTPWRLSLDLALRLGHSMHAPLFSTQADFDTTRGRSRYLALSGTLPGTLTKENRLDYALGAACANPDAPEIAAQMPDRDPLNTLRCTEQLTFDLAYAGTHGAANAAFSRNGSVSFGTGGSVVLHRAGVTFGPMLGDTIALVDTKQGAGLRLAGTSQVQADRRGYAIVPNLTPYRLNDIEIDQASSPANVRIVNSSRVVAPVAGAIVRVAMEATRVDARRFRISMKDGHAPPFGAAVRTADGQRVGSMGQGGRLTLPENIHGTLHVALAAARSTCRIDLDEIGSVSLTLAPADPAPRDGPVHLKCR
jgi:outer membrane usher protein